MAAIEREVLPSPGAIEPGPVAGPVPPAAGLLTSSASPPLDLAPTSGTAGGLGESATASTGVVAGWPVKSDVILAEDVDGAPNLRRRLVLLDLMALMAAWFPAILIGLEPIVGLRSSLAVASALTLVGVGSMYANHLYLARVSAFRSIEIASIGRCAVITTVLGIAGFRLVHIDQGVRWLVVGGAFMMTTLLIGRSGYRAWLTTARVEGRFVRPIVIVGTGEEAQELVEMLHDHPDAGYRVCGVIGDRTRAVACGLGPLWRGTNRQAVEVLRHEGANGVILVSADLAPVEMNALVGELQQRGVHIHLSNGVRGINFRRLRATPIAYEPLFYLEPLQLNSVQLFAKRVSDLAVGAFALVITAPLMLAIALAIKLDDGGPVFFKQRRVGQHGTVFSVYKFRTMVVDAEARLHELNAQNVRSGPLFKMGHDPRVTRCGRFLRSTSLDELPQLFNVIRGEMSLVGPRPALPSEVAQFDERLVSRSRVRPGITGLWQIEARDNPNFGAYRRLDLFYVENWSFGLDMVILLGTVEQVLAKTVSSLVGHRHD